MLAELPRRILISINSTPRGTCTPPQLARSLGLSVKEVQSRLLELEGAGYVERPRPNVPLFALTTMGRTISVSADSPSDSCAWG